MALLPLRISVSDQAETVLFRLLRGSGLDGLKGMTYKSGRWVKPLLDMFKQNWLDMHSKTIFWMETPVIRVQPGVRFDRYGLLWKHRPQSQKCSFVWAHLCQGC